MSITLAAQDLCLTQSAVSRQVQALEEALGVKLLNRSSRAISFTPEGERLFKVADVALQQLQGVWGNLTEDGRQAPVTITGCTSVMGLWLLPRLGGLRQQHPGIDVRVASNDKPQDLRIEGADIAIRYCAEDDAPVGAMRLFRDVLLPVAHPSLACAGRNLMEEIPRQALLEFDNPKYPWLHWPDFLEASMAYVPKPASMLRFNQYSQVIQAAVAGQGIALGRLALVQPLLDDKRLAVWGGHEEAHPSGYSYWLALSDAQPRRDVRDVADWIKAQVQLAETQAEQA